MMSFRSITVFALLAISATTHVSARKMGSKGGSKGTSVVEMEMEMDTDICTCENKAYIVSQTPINFAFAQAEAYQMGCQLATFNTAAEQALIREAIANTPQIIGMNNFWVGLLRPYDCPSGNCDTGAAAEGWTWLDGCTTYVNDFWAAGQPNNFMANGLQQNQGWIDVNAELQDESPNVIYRGVYECCVPPTQAPTTASSKGKGSMMGRNGGGRNGGMMMSRL